jgi:hypothetical protein
MYPIRWPSVTMPVDDCVIKRLNAAFETGISETNIRDTVTWEIKAVVPTFGDVSYVVYFETALSSARAWSIWSYA